MSGKSTSSRNSRNIKKAERALRTISKREDKRKKKTQDAEEIMLTNRTPEDAVQPSLEQSMRREKER